MYSSCTVCPRRCKVDRRKVLGFCNSSDTVSVSRADRHMWEEPIVSGDKGSGTVFFTGCNLKCVYCQNVKISRGNFGYKLTHEKLKQLFLEIDKSGVHNINLVTPTHFLPSIIEVLKEVKNDLNVPVIYNCSGYENVSLIKECRGLIDVFLTDFKYKSDVLSKKYSSCPDYYEKTLNALNCMIDVAGPINIENGLIKNGVIVRHLILPSHKDDSIDLLKSLYEKFGSDKFIVSLMRQFTPNTECEKYPEINRTLTSLEYKRVTDVFEECGFKGFLQENSSVGEKYTPDFNEPGEFLKSVLKL